MGGYKIFFRASVEKDLKRIPRKYLKKVLDRIRALSDNPRPRGCEKLSIGEKYRIRHGHYRIVYSIQDDELTVWVVKVGHRKDVYR